MRGVGRFFLTIVVLVRTIRPMEVRMSRSQVAAVRLTPAAHIYLSRADEAQTLVRLQAQIDAEARGAHVRTYDTLAELSATCTALRCTLHVGHAGEHYDGIRGEEVAA